MNATAKQGVWVAQINENIDVIIDTNRNQILKRENGVLVAKYYFIEITVGLIDFMLDMFRRFAKINDDYQAALSKFHKRREQKTPLCTEHKGVNRKEIKSHENPSNLQLQS